MTPPLNPIQPPPAESGAEKRTSPALHLRVLVVDDEANIRKTMAYCLETAGHQVTTAASFQEALDAVQRRAYDLAFVDLRLGAADGMDLIPLLVRAAPWIRIVVITAYASIDTAIEAMRRGAYDYLPKPFQSAQVRMIAEKVADLRALERRVAELKDKSGRADLEPFWESANPAMQRALDTARQVASTDAGVLLLGESGTGKSLLARFIHLQSHRAAYPLAVVSCPTLSHELLASELFGHVKGAFTGAFRDHPGRVAVTDGGTLFLDEIGDLPQAIQPQLLRFLQDKEYERLGDHVTRRADVRIIAATNADLKQAVAGGRFREDLFYRLNVIGIPLPPLRERPEDIEPLALTVLAFLGDLYHKPGLSFRPDALAALAAYPWPGNVRELHNVVERAVILTRTEWIGPEHLPEALPSGRSELRVGDLAPLALVEERHIRGVLAATGSLQEAARVLGIDPATLWRRRKQHGIE